MILFGDSVGIHSLITSSFNHPPDVAIVLSFVGILGTIIVNPLLKETLMCGYSIHRLANKGPGVAITFGAFVRFSYNTYTSSYLLFFFKQKTAYEIST